MKLDRVLRLIGPLFVVSLVISITLNLFLYTQGQEYYLQLNETRLDPLGLSYYPSASGPKALTTSGQTVVVFFGDSRAASWPPPANLEGFEFINRGIGAQTSTQTLHRFEAHVKPLQPHIVILQVGINDLKTIPLFPERKEAIIANCQANIQQIVAQATRNGTTVILTTLFPTGQVPWERQLFWSPDVAQAVDEVNIFIHSLEAQNVIIFDAYALLTDNDIARDEYFHDTLHLNVAGYEALNVELGPILATLK
jgi:lysophospholipase L1-like esterase